MFIEKINANHAILWCLTVTFKCILSKSMFVKLYIIINQYYSNYYIFTFPQII